MIRGVLWLLAAALWLMCSSAQAKAPDCSCSKEWVQTFRGNQHRSFYGTGYIPAKLKIRWRFRTRWIRDSRMKGYGGRPLIWRGTGWSGQAAVVGDRVWVSSVGGVLYCLNRHTGRKIWSFNAGLSIKSSVTYWNGRVYFGSRSNRLYCLNAKTGKKLWTFRTPGRNVDSTPLVWKGRMYWGAEDTKLYAMNPLNGKIHWTYQTMGSIESSPMIHEDKIYINSYDGHLHCLDLKTGKLHWRFRTGDDTDTTPTYHKGLIYFGSENGKVYAVTPQTGELVWERQMNGGIWSTPALAGERLFVGSNGRRVHGLDARTGRQLWKYKTGDGVWASLVHVAGRLLVGDWSGYVHVIRASDGQRFQRVRIGVPFAKDGNHIVSTAAVVKGRVYLGSRDGHFYCFEGPKQPSARQRRVMRRWRTRYGESMELVVTKPGVLATPSREGLGSLSAVVPNATLRTRLVAGMTATKRYPRLLLARYLGSPGLPKPLALKLLRHTLQDSADHIRLAAAKATARYGKEGAALVAGLLADRDDRVRAVACDVLSRFGQKSHLPALRKRLWDHSAQVQANCAKALLHLGQEKEAKDTLRRVIFGGQHRGWFSRARTQNRTPRYGCPSRVSKYYLYRGKDGKIRRTPREKLPILTALLALRKLGDSCASKHLFSRWYSCRGDRETGYCSIYSDWQGWMKRMLPLWIIPLAPKSKQLRLLKRHGLPRYKDKNQRANAVLHLNTLSVPGKAPILIRLLQREKYPLLRILAARGLAKLSGAKVSKALAKALAKDRYPDVRLAVARSLVALQGKAAVPALAAQAAKEKSDRARAGLAALLVQYGHVAAYAMAESAMTSASYKARCLAMRGLATYDKGLAIVQKTLQHRERFLRICAVQALVGLGATNPRASTYKKRTSALLAATQHSDLAVSLRATLALLR